VHTEDDDAENARRAHRPQPAKGHDPLYFAPTSGAVMVMPRLGEGWLVSRYGNSTISLPAAGMKDEPDEIKTQLAGDVKPEKLAQPLR